LKKHPPTNRTPHAPRLFKDSVCSTLVIASLALSLCMAAIGAPKPVEGIAVRVESRSGAPRLTVDDRPVRARMFFGGPASTQFKKLSKKGSSPRQSAQSAQSPLA
jgi:hypothetical protein